MCIIKKYNTNIDDLYTYIEFENYSNWEDYDVLQKILWRELKCKIKIQVDGIYSRYTEFNLNEMDFQLMYHEDYGNCLYSQTNRDEDYYIKLESIAQRTAEIINNKIEFM